MRSVESSIELAAGRQEVWQVLTDFRAYPEWSRFILSVEGEPVVGTRLRVTLDDGRRTVKVRPTVAASDEPSRFAWTMAVGPPGMFRGMHEFVLIDAGAGRTRLEHRESYSGLVAAVVRSPPRRAAKAFGDFNLALERRLSESGAIVQAPAQHPKQERA